jgi:hypothetical protein
MSNYVSAEAFLADARLRLDALGAGFGVLVVEGPDDKRLFYGRVGDPAQLLPAGGRRLLLAAFAAATAADRDRIVFITDCDYAVRSGELTGGHGIVITSGTDVESDLLSLGLLPKIVTEIVPSALSADRIELVADHALKLATALALPVGRLRMAAQPLGVDLGFEQLDFSKYWARGAAALDVEKLLQVMGGKLRGCGCDVDLVELIRATPSDTGMCHGKDLLSALRTVLIQEHRVDQKITAELLGMMLRLVLDDARFEQWRVVQRIRAWESKTGARILSSSGAAQ